MSEKTDTRKDAKAPRKTLLAWNFFASWRLCALVVIVSICACIAAPTFAAPDPSQLVETRYIDGTVVRNARGEIVRSKAVTRAFAEAHFCPDNGLPDAGCPGWAIQHALPLACGGRDAVDNMIWLKDEYKTGYAILPSGRVAHMGYLDDAGQFVDMMRFAPDRVERLIGARAGVPVPGSSCLGVVVK